MGELTLESNLTEFVLLPFSSMSKVANAGEDHGQAMLVGGVNDFLVTDGATWLNDGLDTAGCDFFHIIGKGEEGIAG